LIKVVGRLKSVINISGIKIFPEEIENVLESIPQIKQARITSNPHPLLGEIIEGEIVLKEGENDGITISGFLDNNEDELEKQFGIAHNFQTSTRGIKIRGVYPSMEEAELRCKLLREVDPNHDVYVGPVGMWVPFHPDAYKTGRVEYMEEELNQLHHEKLKNEAKAKEDFEKRVKETKRKAIEENIKKANQSGNVLTQTMDENGNLIGVKETVDFEGREATTEEETKKYNEELLARELAKK
jgi:hypothetical protein